MQNKIAQYFSSTPLLAKLCTQNGWMDEDSLRITLLETEHDALIYEVRFEEILKEGSGCECGRIDCWGKVKIKQGADGEVIDAQIISGVR